MKFLILLMLLPLSCLATAAEYTDSKLPVRLNVPAQWKVRPTLVDGRRALRIIPPEADQRERAAIEVIVFIATLQPKQSLSDYAKAKRGKGEPITPLAYDAKQGRLETDYRDGHYVSRGLWIVQRTKMVLQRVDKTRLIDARCSANLTEYKTYRKALESICKSVQTTAR